MPRLSRDSIRDLITECAQLPIFKEKAAGWWYRQCAAGLLMSIGMKAGFRHHAVDGLASQLYDELVHVARYEKEYNEVARTTYTEGRALLEKFRKMLDGSRGER